MKKAFLLSVAAGGALLTGATSVSAETVTVDTAAQHAPAAKLAAAEPQGEAGATQANLPEPAGPKTKKKRRFFGLPLLGLAAAGGGTGLAVSGGNGNAPASP